MGDMLTDYFISKHGFFSIFIAFGLAILVRLYYPVAFPFALVMAGMVVYFFRNPRRSIPEREGIIVAPADGLVLSVRQVEEPYFLQQQAWKVSIFLSVFDVHMNRLPIGGEIAFKKYIPGKYLVAWREKASTDNERNLVGVQNGSFKVLVVQIAGLIARRIVCPVQVGDKVKAGDLFGLIKFGSCVEVYFPLDMKPIIKEGDKVRGGETVIAESAN
ncbi:MAG: phosphatidylserine decarboxylase family protein [Bacillota bacterium]